MKKLLIYILIIFSITLCMSYIFDMYYTHVFETSKPRSKLQMALKNDTFNYDVIFIGNSRVENNIDCETVTRLTGKSCMNFGIAGVSNQDQLVLLHILKSKGATFDYIFIQTDATYNNKGLTKAFRGALIPYMDDKVIQPFLKDEVSWGDTYVPMYRYMRNDKILGLREIITVSMGKETKIDLANGWVPKDGNHLKNITPNTTPIVINDNPEVDDVKKSVNLLANTVFWFVSPYCSEKNNRSMIPELKEKIPDLVSYINFFDGREEHFFNCGHLNREGAVLFTEHIVNDLLLNK